MVFETSKSSTPFKTPTDVSNGVYNSISGLAQALFLCTFNHLHSKSNVRAFWKGVRLRKTPLNADMTFTSPDIWSMFLDELSSIPKLPFGDLIMLIIHFIGLVMATPYFADILVFLSQRSFAYIIMQLPPATQTSTAAQAVPPSKAIDAIITPISLKDLEGENCSICFESYTRPVMLKQCGHTFCDSCIRSTLATISHCPLDTRPLFNDAPEQPQIRPNDRMAEEALGPFAQMFPGVGAAVVGLVLLAIEVFLKVQDRNISITTALWLIVPSQRFFLAHQVSLLRVSANSIGRAMGLPPRDSLLFEVCWPTQFLLTSCIFATWAQMTLIFFCWIPFLWGIRARFGMHPFFVLSRMVPFVLESVFAWVTRSNIRAGEPEVPEL